MGGPGPAPHNPLSAAAEEGRLTGLVEPSSPLVPILDAAGRRFLRPLHVQVVGRPGVGRDTMARALRERLSLTAIGPGEGDGGSADADLWILVLAGLPRRADHALLASLPADRTVVVLGKADTHGDWDTATTIAGTCSRRLGVPVHAVSALLSCADLDEDEFAALTALAADGMEMPSMAGRFLVGRPGSAERLMRQALLRRIDAFGIDTALRLIGSGAETARDARALNSVLHGIGGVGELAEPIGERVARVRYWREVELRAEIERAAARDLDRENAERLLAAGVHA